MSEFAKLVLLRLRSQKKMTLEYMQFDDERYLKDLNVSAEKLQAALAVLGVTMIEASPQGGLTFAIRVETPVELPADTKPGFTRESKRQRRRNRHRGQ